MKIRGFIPLLVFHIIVLIGPLVSFSNTAKADLLGFLAGNTIYETLNNFSSKLDEISERRVRELLASLESTAERSISQGIAGGQLLAVQAGHSLNVATQSAAAILGEQIDSSVSEVDRSLQEMLVLLVQFEKQVSEAKDEAFDFADLLSLDLEIIAGRVVGIDEAPLHLRGFSNTVFAIDEGSGNKSVIVRGPFFGSDPDGISTKYAFSIDGSSIGAGRVVPGLNSKHDREVLIPPQAILRKMSETKIQVIDLRLDVARTNAKRCWIFFRCHRLEALEVIIPLTVLPRLIGTVTIQERRPKYDYVAIDERFELPMQVGASATISLSLPAIPNSGPAIGQKIFDRSDVIVTCTLESRNFRKFIQDDNLGTELPANHALFVKGLVAKNVGPGRHSRGNDVDGPGTVEDVTSRIAKRMESIIGIKPFIGRAPLLKLVRGKLSHLVYNKGWHTQDPWINYDMSLSAKELRSVSEAYTRDISGCAQQTNGPPIFRNDTDFQVPITSSTTKTSIWKVSVRQLQWSEVGLEEEQETIDVRVGELAQFEVVNPNETDILLRFRAPILGIDEQFTPDAPPEGFEFTRPSRLGDADVRRFRFRL